jgi:hypothetical protein
MQEATTKTIELAHTDSQLSDQYSEILKALSTPKIKPFVQTIHIYDAKELLYAIMLRRNRDVGKTDDLCHEWMAKYANEINICLGWLIGVNDPDYPTRKGLVLYGFAGTGKTSLMAALIELDRALALGRLNRMVKARVIARHLLTNPFELPNSAQALVIDDLGKDEPENHFGTVRDTMEDLIEDRYVAWHDNGILTCFTTNLHWDSTHSLSGRYEDFRTERRLRDMASPVHFKK